MDIAATIAFIDDITAELADMRDQLVQVQREVIGRRCPPVINVNPMIGSTCHPGDGPAGLDEVETAFSDWLRQVGERFVIA